MSRNKHSISRNDTVLGILNIFSLMLTLSTLGIFTFTSFKLSSHCMEYTFSAILYFANTSFFDKCHCIFHKETHWECQTTTAHSESDLEYACLHRSYAPFDVCFCLVCWLISAERERKFEREALSSSSSLKKKHAERKLDASPYEAKTYSEMCYYPHHPKGDLGPQNILPR
jgi:hypothetical protein